MIFTWIAVASATSLIATASSTWISCNIYQSEEKIYLIDDYNTFYLYTPASRSLRPVADHDAQDGTRVRVASDHKVMISTIKFQDGNYLEEKIDRYAGTIETRSIIDGKELFLAGTCSKIEARPVGFSGRKF